jgi:hypothetical protein
MPDICTDAPSIALQQAIAHWAMEPAADGGTPHFATVPGLQFRSDSSTNSAEISSYQGDLEFITGVTERLRITSAGLVGIGTSAPSNTLHVNGTGGGSFTSGFTNALARISATTIPLGKEPRLHLLHLQQKKRLGLFPLNIRQVITEILRLLLSRRRVLCRADAYYRDLSAPVSSTSKISKPPAHRTTHLRQWNVDY